MKANQPWVDGGGSRTGPKKGKKGPSSARARAKAVQPVEEPQAGEFIPMDKWDGPKAGMIYKVGAWGPGYYLTAAQQRSSRSTTSNDDPPGSASSDGPPRASNGVLGIFGCHLLCIQPERPRAASRQPHPTRPDAPAPLLRLALPVVDRRRRADA